MPLVAAGSMTTPAGAVKKFKPGQDREGEAPAEPHEARSCWGDGSPGGHPPDFFTAPPKKGEAALGLWGLSQKQTGCNLPTG